MAKSGIEITFKLTRKDIILLVVSALFFILSLAYLYWYFRDVKQDRLIYSLGCTLPVLVICLIIYFLLKVQTFQSNSEFKKISGENNTLKNKIEEIKVILTKKMGRYAHDMADITVKKFLENPVFGDEIIKMEKLIETKDITIIEKFDFPDTFHKEYLESYGVYESSIHTVLATPQPLKYYYDNSREFTTYDSHINSKHKDIKRIMIYEEKMPNSRALEQIAKIPENVSSSCYAAINEENISNWEDLLSQIKSDTGNSLKRLLTSKMKDEQLKIINTTDVNQLDKVKYCIVAAFNANKNNLYLYEEEIADKNIETSDELKVRLNKLKEKGILKESGALATEVLKLSNSQREDIRWLNLAILNTLFPDFLSNIEKIKPEFLFLSLNYAKIHFPSIIKDYDIFINANVPQEGFFSYSKFGATTTFARIPGYFFKVNDKNYLKSVYDQFFSVWNEPRVQTKSKDFLKRWNPKYDDD